MTIKATASRTIHQGMATLETTRTPLIPPAMVHRSGTMSLRTRLAMENRII